MYAQFLQAALRPIGDAGQRTRPARRLGELAVEHTAKLIQLQLDTTRFYTDMGLGQLRASVSIHDTESMQQYLASQSAVVESILSRMSEDMQAMVDIGQSFASGASSIVPANAAEQDAAQTTTSQPKTTTRRVAKKGAAAQSESGTRRTTANRAKSKTSS